MKAQFEISKINIAKRLLRTATRYQAMLLESNFSNEVIDRSTPIVWFGNPEKGNWITIATNPSSKEFLDTDGSLLLGKKARFYVRGTEETLEEYEKSDNQLESTIAMYNSYFDRDTTYRSWFGKKNGAKLEGFLNGMGGSLYSSDNKKRVVHTDFFPIATQSQMGRVKDNKRLLDSKFAREFIIDTLSLLEPSLIIILGKEHCNRFKALEEGIYLDDPRSIPNFPSAKYQLGFHSRLNSPIVGLHFKPSEQFIGLGGMTDENGNSHGDYAKKASLNRMGSEVLNQLKLVFSDLTM